MLSKFLLFLAAIALALALRSVRHGLVQRLGTLAIVGATAFGGWLFTGSWLAAVLCALVWLFLPWIDLLTRIRTLTLPINRPLRHKTPPRGEAFPALDDLTDEVEQEKFEHVEDSGWDLEEYQQFFRLFYKKDERLQAAVCLVEQQDVAFYYLALSSREKDGTLWTTWNYPFSYSLKCAPAWRMNRLRGDVEFLELLESHRHFLRMNKVEGEQLLNLAPDALPSELQKDFSDQIAHNLAAGVLQPANEGEVRYSWRGLFYLWFQFLRDIVHL